MSKGTRALPILIAIVAVAVCALPAAALHDDGVAHCNACHTMHNSENNATIVTGGTQGLGVSAYLLKAAKPTDTCLLCHATGSRGVFGVDPMAPAKAGGGTSGGGDFVFLTEDNLYDGHGSSTIPGYQAGHNVISTMKAVGADPVNTTSPGGDYPAASLACTSCHDPHGTDEFRILYGANRIVKGDDGASFVFLNPAPEAAAAPSNNGETNTNHTAYVSGMSAWCGNCHGDFHDNDTNLIHPSGTTLGGTIAAAYNAYNGTTDCVTNPPLAPGAPCGTGDQATAYLAQVPFEDAGATPTSTAGPNASSRVMCLTCHRAHATSAPNAGRWDFQVTLLSEDGEGGAYALPNPYDGNQRSLCNKCHSKDEFDHLPIAPPPP
jgi:hypothetical protein